MLDRSCSTLPLEKPEGTDVHTGAAATVTKEKRRWRKALLKTALAVTITSAAGFYELSKDVGDGRPEQRIAYTTDDIVRLLKGYTGPEVRRVERYSPRVWNMHCSDPSLYREDDLVPEESIATNSWEMVCEAAGELGSVGKDLIVDTGETVDDISDTVSAAADFSLNYQLPREEVDAISASETENSEKQVSVDCNDHTIQICAYLAEHDVPSYILSLWTQDPRQRLHKDWHQMAAVKVEEDLYIIIDNSLTTHVWHGSLREFAHQYTLSEEHPASIVWFGGLTPYREPRWNNFAGRAAVHLRNVTSEDQMESPLAAPSATHVASVD